MIEDEVIPTKVVEVCNGVDADGNPFNFTDDMLKLGQVVQTRNLDMYVVVNHDDNIALADITGGWVSNPTIINENEHIEFDIINVYEPNSPYRAFQFNTYQGKLIWSANHSKKTQAEQDIADLEESIKLDTEKLVVLKSQITK